MNFLQFLEEGGYANKPLIIVDIQPAYSRACNHIITENFQRLLETHNRILWFYNGEELGIDDKPFDILNWLVEDHGLDYDILEELFHKIEFKEKGYGYLREFIDDGISNNIIIKILREMIIKRVHDSRDLNLEELLGDDYNLVDHLENIYFNDVEISLSQLKQFNNCYIVGGGKDECLAEILIIMNAFNIKYTILKEFVY
jgi:hypothetical protein